MSLLAASGNVISWNIVNRNSRVSPAGEEALARKITILGKHLGHFPAESLHLQAILDKSGESYEVRLSLRTPSHILEVEKSAENLQLAIESAIQALVREVQLFESDRNPDQGGRGGRYHAELRPDQTLVFSEPALAGAGPQTLTDMVAELLSVHRERLSNHADRLIHMAELSGAIPAGTIAAQSLIDRVDKHCLADPGAKPEAMSDEAWFYLVLAEEFSRQKQSSQAKRRNEKPAELEHFPSDSAELGREIIEALEQFVKNWPEEEQEVFELYFLVGLEAREIAMIRRQLKHEVETLIEGIHLRMREILRDAAS